MIIGHENVINNFQKSLDTKRLHHAWLLRGPKGVGKATFALYMAYNLLLNNQKLILSETPEIKDLKNKINQGTINSFKYISPQVLNKQEIGVADIREITESLKLKSEESYNVIVIDCLNNVNKNAQNALLKTLEEPQKNVVFFLIDHQIGNILDTIKSRCMVSLFSNLTEYQNKKILEEILEIDISSIPQFLIEIYSGSTGMIMQLMNSQVLNVLKQLHAFLTDTSSFNYEDIDKLSDLMLNAVDNDNITTLGEILQILLLKVLKTNDNDYHNQLVKLNFINDISTKINELRYLNSDKKTLFFILLNSIKKLFN